MPTFAAYMEIEEVEGVASIRPAENRILGIKFECGSCHEVGQKYVYVDPSETTETEGGGVRHAAFKCSFCDVVITTNIISWGKHICAKATNGEEDEDDPESEEDEGGKLFTLDVRRGEPVELELDDQWVVEAQGGALFEQVDLSQDWCEYDEASGKSVSLLGVSVVFKKAENKQATSNNKYIALIHMLELSRHRLALHRFWKRSKTFSCASYFEGAHTHTTLIKKCLEKGDSLLFVFPFYKCVGRPGPAARGAASATPKPPQRRPTPRALKTTLLVHEKDLLCPPPLACQKRFFCQTCQFLIVFKRIK
eukprot:gene12161-8365_t